MAPLRIDVHCCWVQGRDPYEALFYNSFTGTRYVGVRLYSSPRTYSDIRIKVFGDPLIAAAGQNVVLDSATVSAHGNIESESGWVRAGTAHPQASFVSCMDQFDAPR